MLSNQSLQLMIINQMSLEANVSKQQQKTVKNRQSHVEQSNKNNKCFLLINLFRILAGRFG